MTLVFMFPGQSSRYPGMVHKIAALSRSGRARVDQASELLGRDLWAHYREDNADAYAGNQDVQIGVFLANHLFLEALSEADIEAQGSLGLSLGEWNHLVHIGALPFADALRAVAERGAAYDAGPRGAMASVFPMELAELEQLAERVRAEHGLVEVVNLNSPRQQVLSGEASAIDAAVRILDDEYYIDAVIIERQVPMHASLFEPVGRRFADYLRTVPFQAPRLPYLPNRLAQIIERPKLAELVELLSSHVHQPVLWRASVDRALERWPDATLVEVGPKRVLYNLLDRKWHKGVRKLHTDSSDNADAHLAAVIAELSK